jgi:hypothetical protein
VRNKSWTGLADARENQKSVACGPSSHHHRQQPPLASLSTRETVSGRWRDIAATQRGKVSRPSVFEQREVWRAGAKRGGGALERARLSAIDYSPLSR